MTRTKEFEKHSSSSFNFCLKTIMYRLTIIFFKQNNTNSSIKNNKDDNYFLGEKKRLGTEKR